MQNQALPSYLAHLPSALGWTLEGSTLPAILPNWLKQGARFTSRADDGATWEEPAPVFSHAERGRLLGYVPSRLWRFVEEWRMSSDLDAAALVVRAWEGGDVAAGAALRVMLNTYSDALACVADWRPALDGAYHHAREVHAWTLGRPSMREPVWDIAAASACASHGWESDGSPEIEGYREAGAALEAAKAAQLLDAREIWEAAITRACVGLGMVVRAANCAAHLPDGSALAARSWAASAGWPYAREKIENRTTARWSARLRGWIEPFRDPPVGAYDDRPSYEDRAAVKKADLFAARMMGAWS